MPQGAATTAGYGGHDDSSSRAMFCLKIQTLLIEFSNLNNIAFPKFQNSVAHSPLEMLIVVG